MNARVFATIEDARAYVLAGDATVTLEFRRFGTHFTYKVTRCKDKAQPDLYFVSLLTQDTAEFKYLGIITRNGFRLTKNSGVNANAPSAKAFESLFCSTELDPELEVRHEVYCGRALTKPES
jgi:hypothetical protein